MKLPAISERVVGRAELFDAVQAPDFEQGFVRARAYGNKEVFLFVREGRAWCAGAVEDGTFTTISVKSFLENMGEHVTIASTDLPLFLCAGVLFRKPPAAHIPAALIDAEMLVKSLAALGKDAVLAVHAHDSYALAFVRSGEPVTLYAAPELGVQETGDIADRLMELIYAMREDVVIDLYDEIRLPPSADAGLALGAYADIVRQAESSRPTLVVMLGERVVFRHRIDREETLIGRDPEAQLALDNLSVSRRHAMVKVYGNRVVIEDLDSENGLMFAGYRTRNAELKPGERVGIGKYTLTYALDSDTADAGAPRRAMLSSDIDTVSLEARHAILEHAGRKHKVASAVFTIGSAKDAGIRIGGFFVADVQAVLQIDGDGYRVERVGRARRMKVNGVPMDVKRLSDGDEICIAGEVIRFREAA